jgi:hypothetical protein
MDSAKLEHFDKGFSSWHLFNKKTAQEAPLQHGVYVIRMHHGKCFGRLRSESDIVYVGKSEAQSGIRERLISYFTKSGPTQWTDQRIHRLKEKYQWEIAWCQAQNPQDMERQLLKTYEEEHDELRPLNRATRNLLRGKANLSSSFHIRRPHECS